MEISENSLAMETSENFSPHLSPWRSIALCSFILIPLLYKLSQTARFYIRIMGYYLTFFTVGWMAVLICICYLGSRKGTDMVFKVFKVCSSWTGIRVNVRGGEKLQSSTPIVIISNHQSSLDIICMCYCWPSSCTVLMKKSLKYIPGFNIAAALSHGIYVDRFDRENAHSAIQSCVEAMMERNLKIWVFPEGTRNHEDGLLQFKKGAFNIAVQAQIPIVPVVISSYHSFYSKSERYFHDNGNVIIEVLDPISTTNLTHDDVPRLTEEVRKKMLSVFKQISVDASAAHLTTK